MARRRARRADASRTNRGPRHVTLVAGYGPRPGDSFAEWLPLSADLVRGLNAWNDRWSDALGDLGAHMEGWLDEGAELARLVQLEAERAGEDIQVIYWHDRSRNPRHGRLGERAPEL